MAKIILGITGSIAAYKSCDLARDLISRGHQVSVIMTQHAQKFISATTFYALTHQPVQSDLFFKNPNVDKPNPHIEVLKDCDCFIICPATANIISKCALGLADDFLSTAFLAYSGSVLFVPAMNSSMWNNEAIKTNIQTLMARGHELVNPQIGLLACNTFGEGKIASHEIILERIENRIQKNTLKQKHFLITAGSTREYFDPVRFISSPSSGKFASNIAQTVALHGGRVTYVHGVSCIKPSHPSIQCIQTQSANDMLQACLNVSSFDVLVALAAVSDYRPSQCIEEKISKQKSEMNLHLVKNPDIVMELSKQKTSQQIFVGFAAQTHDVIEHAKIKLNEKKLDFIVANEVYKESKGFDVDTTNIYIIDHKEVNTHQDITKKEAAKLIVKKIESLL